MKDLRQHSLRAVCLMYLSRQEKKKEDNKNAAKERLGGGNIRRVEEQGG